MEGSAQRTTSTILKRRTTGAALLLIVVVTLLAGFVLFWHLGTEPLQDYDEATYAQVTRESIMQQHSLSLSFLHQNYFRKPPFAFWVLGVSQTLIHDPEAGPRAVSAISAFLTIVLVGLLTFEATGSLGIGLLSALILTTTSAFIESARQTRLDTLVTLFDVAALYAFRRALLPNERQWYLALGLCVGLAILTKGPLVLYGLAAIVVYALCLKRAAWLKDRYFWGGLGIMLLVVLPWHIYETLQFGGAFWQQYVGDQVIQRVSTTLFTNQPDNGGYLVYAYAFAAPWFTLFTLFFLSSPLLVRKMPLQRSALYGAALAGVGSVLCVCFVTSTKALTYLIPLYPFMAIAVALGIERVYNALPQRFHFTYRAVGAFLVAAGLWLTCFNSFHIDPYYKAEVSLAYEEKAIAQALIQERASNFYYYNVTTLGSIMYYSGLVQPLDLNVQTTLPTQGTCILYAPHATPALATEYLRLNLQTVYTGDSLALDCVRG